MALSHNAIIRRTLYLRRKSLNTSLSFNQVKNWKDVGLRIVLRAVGAGDAAFSKFLGAKFVRFGQIWLDLGGV